MISTSNYYFFFQNIHLKIINISIDLIFVVVCYEVKLMMVVKMWGFFSKRQG